MFDRILKWLKHWREKRHNDLMFEREVIVRFDEHSVSASYPNGETQRIRWEEVGRVAIETNDSGPWGADVWWILEGENHRVVYPQGATGDLEMLAEYEKRLLRFDDEAVIKAMGCTSNARFVCWESVRGES